MDTTKFPARTKCEFCDVTFRCDMDVSRHLRSSIHLEKVSSHMSLQNDQDKFVEKQIPKNFEQLLKRLKVRNVKDLDELVDKGYFNFSDEKLVQILQEISKKLMLSIRDHATKDLPPSIRSIFTGASQATNNQAPPRQTPPMPTAATVPPQPAAQVPPTSSTSPFRVKPEPIDIQTSAVPQAVIRNVVPQPSQSVPMNWTPTLEKDVTNQPSSSRTSGANQPGGQERAANHSQTQSSKKDKQPAQKSSDSQPKGIQPDPKCTYVPKLATIKVEPKE